MAGRFILFNTLLVLLFSFSGYSHVKINNPVGGEIFQAGTNISVSWEMLVDHGPCVWDVYFSRDGGNTWDAIQTGIDKSVRSYSWTIPNINTDEAQIKVVQNNSDYTNVTASTNDFTINGTLGINEIKLKKDFQVTSVAPNPFMHNTLISLFLNGSKRLEITVYNIQGEKVKTIINERLEAGNHRFRWEASDIPKGIYLCRISAGKTIITRRIVRSN